MRSACMMTGLMFITQEPERIATNVPEIDPKLFQGKLDLIMLYDLCRGIALGYIDPKYETKEAPTISTCRWRTVFIRLLIVVLG